MRHHCSSNLKKENLPSVMHYCNVLANSDEQKAQLLATFFEKNSVVSIISPVMQSDASNHCITSFVVEQARIEKILISLDVKKSCDPDDLPAAFLKNVFQTISKSLSQLFKKIRETSKFPKQGKCATVVPIFKKADKRNIAHYRQVSLLPVVSKLFERCIFIDLYDYMIEQLNDAQHGFRKGRWCITQLLVYLDKVYKSVATGEEVQVVYTNFEKAFDKVDHGVLLQKLYRVGVRGKLLKLLKSYLSGRTQRVKVNDMFSRITRVTSGVPQGSLLGPLLFLILINDLSDSCDFTWPLLCADDSKLVSCGLPASNLQCDVDKLFNWCRESNLTVNPAKSNRLCFLHSSETEI